MCARGREFYASGFAGRHYAGCGPVGETERPPDSLVAQRRSRFVRDVHGEAQVVDGLVLEPRGVAAVEALSILGLLQQNIAAFDDTSVGTIEPGTLRWRYGTNPPRTLTADGRKLEIKNVPGDSPFWQELEQMGAIQNLHNPSFKREQTAALFRPVRAATLRN